MIIGHEPIFQEQFNVIRRLAYPQTNIFLLCFNLVDQISFQNVKEKWVPELREYAPKVPIILVGLQSDERNVHPMKWSQGSQKSKPIKTEEGELLARKIGAKKYMECSACTQVSLLLAITLYCSASSIFTLVKPSYT